MCTKASSVIIVHVMQRYVLDPTKRKHIPVVTIETCFNLKWVLEEERTKSEIAAIFGF